MSNLVKPVTAPVSELSGRTRVVPVDALVPIMVGLHNSLVRFARPVVCEGCGCLCRPTESCPGCRAGLGQVLRVVRTSR